MTYAEIHWSLQSVFPVLSALQWLPLAMMLLVMAQRSSRAGMRVALAGSLGELLLAAWLYLQFDVRQSSMQFAEFSHFLSYHAAVDGMGLLFILLTALLLLMVLVYSLTFGHPLRRRELAAVLAVQSALMVQFTTLNLLWFLLASVVQLTLVGYLLRQRSTSPQTDLALSRYFQFMAVGLLLLCLGIVMLGWNHAHSLGGWQFDLFDLARLKLPAEVRSTVFFLLFYGLAIRIPLFPLHGWLPLVAEHGTVAVAGVMLIGIKVGIYGLVRFVFPLLPDAVVQWQVYVMAFATAGIFYAALLALLQRNLRRLLAFAVISHSGIMIIGLFSLEHAAFQGSLLLAVNYGIAGAGLLFMTGMVNRHAGTLLLDRLGGLFDRLPLVGITFLVAGLSIVGMPGTPGFDAAHLVLEAAIMRFGALPSIAASLGNVIAAGFLLFAFQKAFLSSARDRDPASEVRPATMTERLLALSLVAVLLMTGFYSQPWMRLVDASLQPLSALFGGHE